MSLISVQNLELFYHQKNLLDKVSVEFCKGDIIGLVGRNGCGKTSFLNVLLGLEDYNGGMVKHSKDITFGYLAQDFPRYGDLTVDAVIKTKLKDLEKILDEYFHTPAGLEREVLEEKIKNYRLFQLEKQVLELKNIFNCPLGTKKFDTLSGGEKRKVSLVMACLGYPDVLVLDEPTNHIDIKAIESLELFLKNYHGCVIIVSHDRYFLDKVSNKMLEIYDTKLYWHKGSYETFLHSKNKRLEIEAVSEAKKQQFLKRERTWVVAGVQARAVKDKGRMSRYHDLLNKPNFEPDTLPEFVIPEGQFLGSRVVEFEKCTLDPLFSKFSFNIQKGMKIGLVGPNGTGKTTLIKMMMDKLEPSTGWIKRGLNVDFNYFDQEKSSLKLDMTVFNYIGNGQERMPFGKDGKTIGVRKYLSNFLFDRKTVNTPIKALSGGEKARVLLAKLFTKGGNFLVLDEPTNDLDLDTIQVLEEALLNFEGVVVVVSHDRYFLNKVCDQILAFEGNGNLVTSTGNYASYHQKRLLWANPKALAIDEKKQEKEKQMQEKLVQKEKLRLEQRIEKLEQEIKNHNYHFEDPEFYLKTPEKIKALVETIALKTKEVEILYKKYLGEYTE